LIKLKNWKSFAILYEENEGKSKQFFFIWGYSQTNKII
jgi:hypothetical protein